MSSDRAIMLDRLFDGQPVMARAYSVDNVTYTITEEQLRVQAEHARNTWPSHELGKQFEERIAILHRDHVKQGVVIRLKADYFAEPVDAL